MESPSPSLHYAPHALDPRSVKVVRWLYHAALSCAIAPMLIGLSLVVICWATRADWTIIAGVLMLPIGTCMVIVGLAFAITCGLYQRKAHRLNGQSPICRHRLLIATFLLLANFPVAFFCVAAGSVIAVLETRQVVEIYNESGNTIDCLVEAPGDRQEIKSLAPGAHSLVLLSSRGDGQVIVTVTQAGRTVRITAQDYVSGNGFHTRIRVRPGLAPTIEQLP